MTTRQAGIATRTVGLIATPRQAEAIVADGKADMVALARAVLDDPHWGWHAAQVLGAEVARPKQYQRAAPKVWLPGLIRRRDRDQLVQADFAQSLEILRTIDIPERDRLLPC